jgi:hypothetical protein
MFRGVRSVARPLAGKIGDEQIYLRMIVATLLVIPHEEFSSAQNVQLVLWNGAIHPLPASEMRREGSERLPRRKHFAMVPGV